MRLHTFILVQPQRILAVRRAIRLLSYVQDSPLEGKAAQTALGNEGRMSSAGSGVIQFHQGRHSSVGANFVPILYVDLLIYLGFVYMTLHFGPIVSHHLQKS
ncbi:hypothetical protein SAMN05421764_101224 [Donghicola eburneus]|nr:hypothetical protein SAMN05421764_101224 [Donghicola eburneus]